MALFDILKSKKQPKNTEPKKKAKKQDLDEILRPKEPSFAPTQGVELRKGKDEFVDASRKGGRIVKKQFTDAYKILESPHVTEKSGAASDQGFYIFKVNERANKPEIKKAVQDLYGVAVDRVNIISIPRKARRLGRSQGFKPGFKKAMVKLAKGEKIEIMPR